MAALLLDGQTRARVLDRRRDFEAIMHDARVGQQRRHFAVVVRGHCDKILSSWQVGRLVV